jgi:hypothetical protein
LEGTAGIRKAEKDLRFFAAERVSLGGYQKSDEN